MVALSLSCATKPKPPRRVLSRIALAPRQALNSGRAQRGNRNMITVFGEGRGFRVVWLLEEMGLAYRLRPVDLLAGVEKDPEYLAINPGGFIPAIQDGDVTMVES